MTRSRDLSNDQANSGGAIPPFVSGKNAIINGGLDIWQRGTSFNPSAGSGTAYAADRWQISQGSIGSNTVVTATQQTTGLAGSQYCIRYARNSGVTNTGTIYLTQSLETVNSIPFQGKVVTVSFYARAGANYSASGNALSLNVNSGTGTNENINAGFTGGASFIAVTATLTTTWQRFTYTGTVPSNATQLGFYFSSTLTGTAGAADYFEITQFQLEQGSVATPFSRAGGSIGGELALCKRYYHRLYNISAAQVYASYGFGIATSTTGASVGVQFPVPMRIPPSLGSDWSTLQLTDYVASYVVTALALGDGKNENFTTLDVTVASGLTQYRPYFIRNGNSVNGYIGLSAEL